MSNIVVRETLNWHCHLCRKKGDSRVLSNVICESDEIVDQEIQYLHQQVETSHQRVSEDCPATIKNYIDFEVVLPEEAFS